MIELKTRDMEQIFANRFAVGPNGRTALRGRLEHLRRLGTPIGVQQGQGRAAKFGWRQSLTLAAAVELLNVGLTPDHAHRIVSAGDAELIQTFAMLPFNTGTALLDAVESGIVPELATATLLVTADAFSGLRGEGVSPAVSIISWRMPCEAADLPSELHTSRVALNLASVTIEYMRAMSRALDFPKGEIVASFQEWAVQNVHHP